MGYSRRTKFRDLPSPLRRCLHRLRLQS
uniref:Uncharacterized protein n=1 Tax=Rhizophora mucronata TaxID=61149 RepID=A0A2P2PXW9_RHIMU